MLICIAEEMGSANRKNHQGSKAKLFSAFACLATAGFFSPSAPGDVFTVLNANDSGVESLRGRIEAANQLNGPHTINFNITGGPHTIVLESPLPPIMKPVFINGYDEPGASPNNLEEGSDAVLMIGISGENGIATGLDIQAGNSAVRGIAIFDFVDVAIKISNGGNNTIAGNFIGLGLGGSVNLPSETGIDIDYSSENLIGGSDPSDRNVISAHRRGVWVKGNNNDVLGNYIGSRADGGPTFGEIFYGVYINDSSNNVNENLIVGSIVGIGIVGAEGTRIQGNTIGRQGQGNARGVKVVTGANSMIGGSLDGEGNTISFNRDSGVVIDLYTDGHTISRNSIHRNGKLGIDLIEAEDTEIQSPVSGVTENDEDDPDEVPGNDGQNFPIISTAVRNESDIQVSGTFNSLPNQDFTLEFFGNSFLEPADVEGHRHGEGEFYLGSTPVTTDGNGDALFINVPLSPGEGFCVSATATHFASGNTSEFSPCKPMYDKTCTVTEATDAAFRAGLSECANDPSNGTVNVVEFAKGITEIEKTGASFQANGPIEIRGDCNTTITAENSMDPIMTLNDLVFQIGLNIAAPGAIPSVPGVYIAGSGSHVSNCDVIGDPPIFNLGSHNVVEDVDLTTLGFSACDNFGDWNVYSRCTANSACTFEGNNSDIESCAFNGGVPPRIPDGAGADRGLFHPFGVAVISGEGNRISRTALPSTTVPIDLFPIGNTPNDKGDGDEGTNHLNNAPVLHAPDPARAPGRAPVPTATRVHGLLDSTPDTEFVIEVFTNNSGCLPDTYGGADAYLGSFLVETDSSGVGVFDVQLSTAADPGDLILATATDPLGNTSEFSTCQLPESVYDLPLDFADGFEDLP